MTTWHEVLRRGFVRPEIPLTMTLADTVRTATAAVAEHLKQSEPVTEYLRGLPKGRLTACPDSSIAELQKYVAMQRGDIDKSDPILNLAFHEELISPVFDFEREQVFRAVSVIEDLSDQELFLLRSAFRLATYHDLLWQKWFEAVAIPYQRLDANEKSEYERRLEDQVPVYDYTAFDFDRKDGCVRNRRTWSRAFPLETNLIASALRALQFHDQMDRSLCVYFGTLADAYGCFEVDRLEQCWAAVDRAWVRIPTTCRIIPVHGIESGYEHPFGVSPEWRLEVRTDESRDVIERSRIATIEHARAIGMSDVLVRSASRKLQHIDVGVFTNAIRAGVSLNFRYAGQAVPNRQDIVADCGGRIFIDQAAQHLSLATYIEHLEKHCTPETAAALKPLITARNQCIHTVVHEYAHPMGRTKESDGKLGREGMGLLEEAKASLLGVQGDEWRDSTRGNRLNLIAVTVARLIRFMRKNTLQNPTVAPYVRENFVAATTLFDSGVLALTERGLAVDLARAQGLAWFDELAFFNAELLAAYESCDVAELQSLTASYCDSGKEPIAGLIRWVNRE